MFFISPPFGNYLLLPNTINIKGSYTLEPRPDKWGQIFKTLRYSYAYQGWINKIGLRNEGLVTGLKKFDNSKLIVPHIMWNQIEIANEKNLENLSPISFSENKKHMYFVHSYYVEPKDKSTILTKTNYQNFEFCSAVQKNKIIGFQFHPENSSTNGIQILKNFINLIKNDKK